MTDTFELTGSTLDQRISMLDEFRLKVELVDWNTWNATINIKETDVFIDWLEKNNVEYRLI